MNGSVTLRWAMIGLLALRTGASPAVLAQSYADGGRPFSKEELDRLLAPIALYPDSLRAQILVAATCPNEALEADRWVKQNPSLTREALNDSVDRQLVNAHLEPSRSGIDRRRAQFSSWKRTGR